MQQATIIEKLKSKILFNKSSKESIIKRRIKRGDMIDSGWKSMISIGGVGIIFAVLLIMFFLIYVVFPLFYAVKIDLRSSFPVPGDSSAATLFYNLDEYKETAIRVDKNGEVVSFDLASGNILFKQKLSLAGEKIVSKTRVSDHKNLMAFGLSGGGILIAKFNFKVSFPNDKRKIEMEISYPFGEEIMDVSNSIVSNIAVRDSDSELIIVTKTKGDNFVRLKKFDKTESMFSESVTLEESSETVINYTEDLTALLLDESMRNLYLVQITGETQYYDIADFDNLRLRQAVFLTDVVKKEKITSVSFLLGAFSLMIGTDQGRILQWFPVRGDDNLFRLQQIREFNLDEDQTITQLNVENARKGFATVDNKKEFNIFHSTAQRHLATVKLQDNGTYFKISPRDDGLLIEQENGQVVVYDVENEHPDVSFSSLWGKVWYEGYSEPAYVWQSSSADADYEPKFSMVPLTFGTIKAAIYSMLFAVPIAILAALYTAFFMGSKSRAVIKPAIELIEALPTVILGFLAGLWLAPYMEAHLSGFFALVFVVSLGILIVGYGFSKLPERISLLVPIGSRSLLMIPVILFLGWLSFALDETIQNLFFDGDMRHWLTATAGIDFDQRNALVIGFAMGFALIPTIFSVAEDAIYNVPSYLVNGSLALGASGWQTIVGVVLPTASPGIFSAIMLGFGRGVGETMIVLMASGNTPLMDVNIFEGLRTLSANLAVEMGETELYSSHYRVLFLSGLLLFIFTFILNTIAEIVRERMRKKYGSL